MASIENELKAGGDEREFNFMVLTELVDAEGNATVTSSSNIGCFGDLVELIVSYVNDLKDRKCPQCEAEPSDEPCTKH